MRDPCLYGLSILSAAAFDAPGVGAIGPQLLLTVAAGIPHAELTALGVWLISRAASERAALAGSIAVALLSTPMLWLHSLILLCVPLALHWRRLRGRGSCRSACG